MKRLFAPALILAARLSVHAQDGVLDLAALPNYASQPVPYYITKDNADENPITNSGATLGRVLFYDKRLSRNNTISCASCHQQAHGFSDPSAASTGVAGMTGRHAMRLSNIRFTEDPQYFWDERVHTLETQTTVPMRDAVEMGFSGVGGDPAFSDLIAKLAATSEYPVLFKFAFGTSTIDETRIQFAIAQFVRSMQSFDSRYDAGRASAADSQAFANFTASENNGKQLFVTPPAQGGAGCASCHRPPEFDIDPKSGNNGVITSIGGGTDLTNTKAPSLRNLARPNGQLNGPFMHNGAFTTIAQVIDHYAAIPGDNQFLDPRLRRPGGVQTLNLTAQQRLDLEAFLLTLSGNALYTDSKWSNPFSAAGAITLRNVPGDPNPTPSATATPSAPGLRNVSTRVRIETGDNLAIGGFIITGSTAKKVIVRALGPSLAKFGVTDALADPVLELHGNDGVVIASNNNWRQTEEPQITATQLAPNDDAESAIVATLPPGAYTAVVGGVGNSSGVGLVEVYDLDDASSTSVLANLSTRGHVLTGSNVMIGGLIIGGANLSHVVVRAIGPSLAAAGIVDSLQDPTLELRNADGSLLLANDNWTDDSSQSAELNSLGLAPTNSKESAMSIQLSAGLYTAIVQGKAATTGIALVEIYQL
jgi:cytochrome c peroxidase